MWDYAEYFPDNPAIQDLLGCVVVSSGRRRVAPGRRYDDFPVPHPQDHLFAGGDGGRTLDSFTIVFLSAGRGQFEWRPEPGAEIRRAAVQANGVFLLLPGVWHRYAPAPRTGWTEHWLEVRGEPFQNALRSGLLDPRAPVISNAGAEFADLFRRCHQLSSTEPLENQCPLSALALLALALLDRIGEARRRTAGGVGGRVVREARRLIFQRCHTTIEFPSLAAELGVGYSLFRQAFKERTGLSPKQFQQRERLRWARRLLREPGPLLAEIAARLGYSSAFHFSRQFKQGVGESPSDYRRRFGRT